VYFINLEFNQTFLLEYCAYDVIITLVMSLSSVNYSFIEYLRRSSYVVNLSGI